MLLLVYKLLKSASTFCPASRSIVMRSRRGISTSSMKQNEKFKVYFLMPDGERIEAAGKKGDSLLDLVIDNDVPIDGYGACEGTLACSTCHVILKQQDFDALPEQPTDEELDMLDLAHGLTDTSRLGCQIILTKELDGLEVRVPESVHDARGEDG